MKKDLEWARQEILRESEEKYRSKLYAYGFRDGLRIALSKINQLDEPEVLSQELPVIPKFVAELLRRNKKDNFKLIDTYGIALDRGSWADRKLVDWLQEDWTREDIFARAWLDGYTVEEEQKYYVEDGKHTLLCKWESSDGWKVISTIESTEDDLPIEVLDFGLTEQEIKDYDERYWPFAVKVEELEE